MSWRVIVVSNRAKLDLRLNYLVVRGETTTQIHLGEISVLLIESTAVSITSALLCELVKRKIKVIFCDEKRNPCSELTSYYGSHDTSSKIRSQIDWDKKTKDVIWTEIVTEKIRKQKELLVCLNRLEAELLEEYLTQINFRDETNREGHAAKVYFNAIFGMGFTRTSNTPINAALNYGYSIILSVINREIVANGYITQLGIFHDNMFNPFNLGSDLMEPFRPLIDRQIYYMDIEEFEHKEKMEVISVLNNEVIIDDKRHNVNNAMKIYCRSIFDALNEKDVSLIKFYENEL